MTHPQVEQSSRERSLLPVLILIVLAALVVSFLLPPPPADAAAFYGAAAIRTEETPLAVADADSDRAPGMDEAAVAKLP